MLLRSGEKEILHFYIEFTDYITTLLGMMHKDAKKETQLLPKQFENARDYIHYGLLPMMQRENARLDDVSAVFESVGNTISSVGETG